MQVRDLVFLFWSISIGIICGAGFGIIAIISSIIITDIVILFEHLSIGKAPVILLINSEDYKTEKELMETVRKYCPLCRVKARNLTKHSLDMAVEIRTNKETELLEELLDKEPVVSASIVDHDGEVTF